MKLQQLPMGARFEYQGAVYVKTGPMMAAAENGEQKLIPRYAVLKPLDPMPAAADPKAARQLPESAVLAAFDTFYLKETRDRPRFSPKIRRRFPHRKQSTRPWQASWRSAPAPVGTIDNSRVCWHHLQHESR